MKISPATQLIMKAIANTSFRKVLNLNPWVCGGEIKKKITIKIKRDAAITSHA